MTLPEKTFPSMHRHVKPKSATSTPVATAEEWLKENKARLVKAQAKKDEKLAKKPSRNPVSGAYQPGSKEYKEAIQQSQAEYRQALMNLQGESYVRGNN